MTAALLGGSEATLRRDRTSVKWVAYPPDVLPLWVAEMDVAPCPAVVRAVTDAVTRGDTGYGWAPRYAAEVARYAADRWGWRIDASATLVVADVMIGASEVLRLLTDEGGPVVVSPPVYDSFFGFVEAIGRRRVDAPLGADGRLDLAVLEEAFRSATAGGERAAYLLCNPQNPTGAVHTREELTDLATLAERYGVRVVSDEIHAPLTYPGGPDATPYLTVPGGERGIAVFSPSKGWNLAGLKSALVVGGSAARQDVRALHEVHTHGSSHLGEIAHVAALRDGRDWHDRLMAELAANRDLLGRLLAEHLPDVRWTPPEATYLAWLDCRGLGLGDDPAAVFRERGRVALGSGPRYGADAGRGFVRLNLATSPGIVEEAVRRMARSV
ncbi:aminotransferase class I/II-fold pyridoxal phosphate-dependent enzyme [Phycicoccus sp. BSK3Z-2]|uniref:cysteine-S-conjugate beta-lyase n=1 Tax=Phycicoccus avicenniae TaxID=2828860 RepID=A0A941D9K0_9MICO|nr:aminotransferase class I/II-fold pyridoxal phosphate-dependent enzyme [Phycicoccus avicenniae]MBR7742362.1 aminotransferase class I/II-fold pyridoxal phosphate-dependent enzyme [Phycicoccus avicenniae]